jgi:hypothetical protein
MYPEKSCKIFKINAGLWSLKNVTGNKLSLPYLLNLNGKKPPTPQPPISTGIGHKKYVSKKVPKWLAHLAQVAHAPQVLSCRCMLLRLPSSIFSKKVSKRPVHLVHLVQVAQTKLCQPIQEL